MLEQMIESVINKTLATSYPHLKLPIVVYATVVSVRELPDTFEDKELVICNGETGSSYRGHIVAHWYEYILSVADRFGNPDESFPTIPGVRSKLQLEDKALVAVALAYGDIAPAIIGEVLL